MKHPIELARFVTPDGKLIPQEKDYIRSAFGRALVEMGERSSFVVLGADLDSSTKTHGFREKFGEFGKEPFGAKGRWISCGVSEAFMCAAAGGLAARGVKPVLTTFARFLERGYEPLIQSVVIPGFDALVLGSHGGISTGQDGASAHAIEDVALFRALHNVTVLSPGDPLETFQATQAALRARGLVYLRLSRNEFPSIFGKDYAFGIGEAVELIPGQDVTLVTSGETTFQAIVAISKLQHEGLNPRLIHMPTIHPPDQKTLADAAQDSSLFVTVEDHSPRGGLGDAVLEALSAADRPRRVVKLGVEVYAESGKPAELYKKYGLDADGIAARVLAVVKSSPKLMARS